MKKGLLILSTLDMNVCTDRHTECNTGMPQGLIPEATFDHPGVEGWHKDNRPPKPHVLKTNGLPSVTLDEVWEEISELFRDKLGVSVFDIGQSYLSGTIIRGTLKTPNSQLVTPISIKLQRPDGCD
jgi:hypothetical protein